MVCANPLDNIRLVRCQNWRHDVVALIDASGGGQQVEQARYEAYGIPWLAVAGDGDVDSTDKTTAQNLTATKGGRTNLSHADYANRKGYAGYEFNDTITHESYHVRHRVLNSVLGQFLTAPARSTAQYVIDRALLRDSFRVDSIPSKALSDVLYSGASPMQHRTTPSSASGLHKKRCSRISLGASLTDIECRSVDNGGSGEWGQPIPLPDEFESDPYFGPPLQHEATNCPNARRLGCLPEFWFSIGTILMPLPR